MKKGIIFDLDGTLWDSSEQVVKSWNEILRRRPETDIQITLEDMHGYMGKTMKKIAELMMPELPAEVREDILHQCERYENDYLRGCGGVLFPGLEEALAELSRNYGLYIVSNCQMGYIEVFLEYHKLGKYFTDHECNGGTGMEKGDNIRLIIERNGLEKAVYIGDTQGDCDASDYAGVPFIHAAYGFGTINREVPSIASPADISKIAAEYLD